MAFRGHPFFVWRRYFSRPLCLSKQRAWSKELGATKEGSKNRCRFEIESAGCGVRAGLQYLWLKIKRKLVTGNRQQATFFPCERQRKVLFLFGALEDETGNIFLPLEVTVIDQGGKPD
jgi:hypothetical protein